MALIGAFLVLEDGFLGGVFFGIYQFMRYEDIEEAKRRASKGWARIPSWLVYFGVVFSGVNNSSFHL